MAFRLEIRFNNLPGLGERVHRRCGDVVRKATFDVEADAKQRAPVDTGALKASIQGKMIAPLTGEVVCGVHYGIYQEYGTRFQAGTPFLTPAVDQIRAPFFQAIGAAVREELEG